MEQNELKNRFRAIQIIYWVYSSSPVVLGIVFQIIKLSNEIYAHNSANNVLITFSSVLSVILILLSYYLYNLNFKKEIHNNLSVLEKIIWFQKAFIIRISLLQGVGLLNSVCYFLSNSNLLLVIYFITIAILITLIPTKLKLEEEFQLSKEDMKQFD